jgi:hypothetical protein
MMGKMELTSPNKWQLVHESSKDGAWEIELRSFKLDDSDDGGDDAFGMI